MPRGQPLVYAGSIHLRCSIRWESSPSRGCSGDAAIADETAPALAVARKAFADIGPLATALMQRYGDPVRLAVLRDLKPLAVATADEKELVPPDWKARAQEKFSWLGGGGCGRSSGGMAALPAGVVCLGVILVSGLAAVGLKAADASSAESEWGLCMQSLAQDLREIDLAAELRQRLEEKLRAWRIDQGRESGNGDVAASTAQDGIDGALQASVHRIQLRECGEAGTFCLEVAVRARLLDVGTDEPVYDTIFVVSTPARRVYTNEIGAIFSEVLATPAAECRELAAFCGNGGRDLLRTDLTRALDILVKKFLPESG